MPFLFGMIVGSFVIVLLFGGMFSWATLKALKIKTIARDIIGVVSAVVFLSFFQIVSASNRAMAFTYCLFYVLAGIVVFPLLRLSRRNSTKAAVGQPIAESRPQSFDDQKFERTQLVGNSNADDLQQPRWWLIVDRQETGPITATAVKQYLNDRKISLQDYCWTDGYSDWLQIGPTEEFKPIRRPPPFSR
jgi:Ca2+/Na+ antiporter